jgi:hypothetical protein
MDSWYKMSILFTTTTNNTNTINTPYTGSATQVMTIMAWIYLPTLTPTGVWRDIITVDPNIYMQIFTDGTSIDFGTANNDHVGQALAAGVWYHVAQVVVPTSTTSRQIYGYVNGQLNVNVTDTDTSVTYTAVCIGNSIFSTFIYPLNGNAKDVRVWTRQLSATDINDEIQSQVPIHTPGLLLWMPLNDNMTVDKSGNNHIMTVGSAVTIHGGFVAPFAAQ